MHDDRHERSQTFLAQTPWATAQRVPLAEDASSRRYERLSLENGETAILMDAIPEAGQNVRPFMAIGQILLKAGLSPPGLIAADAESGFLLLEDLGDAVFARVIAKDAKQELPLYLAAAEVLLTLRNIPPPASAPIYDAVRMAQLTEPVFTWYAGRDAACGDAVRSELERLLAEHCGGPPVLSLRDFHAENLIWLPKRIGAARVGLLDFQDAVLCHPAYDLVSLLEDARRDVSRKTRDDVFSYYLSATGDDASGFATALALLGLQRNLRILGVFARLSLHYGKPEYVALIPRVWSHIERDLSHLDLDSLSEPVFDLLPPPDQRHLESLKDRCGTIPTL